MPLLTDASASGDHAHRARWGRQDDPRAGRRATRGRRLPRRCHLRGPGRGHGPRGGPPGGRLGARGARGRRVAGRSGLVPYLAGRRLLLVLDNLEQVLDCAPRTWPSSSRSCPDLVLLTTSRAPLRIRAEREVRVAPLAEAEAAQLFVERANAAGADLRPGDHADAIAAICREVDGSRSRSSCPPRPPRRSASPHSVTGWRAPAPKGSGTCHRGSARWRRPSTGASTCSTRMPPRCSAGCRSSPAGSRWPRPTPSPDVRCLNEVRTLREHSLLTRVDDVAGVTRFRLLEPVRQYAVRRWGTTSRRLSPGWPTYVTETAHELGPVAARSGPGHRAGPPGRRPGPGRTAVAWLIEQRRWDDMAVGAGRTSGSTAPCAEGRARPGPGSSGCGPSRWPTSAGRAGWSRRQDCSPPDG